MNWKEIDLNDIDLENMGGWPIQIKIAFAVILLVGVLFGGNYLFISDRLDSLERAEVKEQELREDFQMKYRLAANLMLYRAQLKEMESRFSELLKMLPSENEMPGLIDDMSFVAADAGLRIDSLEWEQEIERDFYVEFPIRMSASGSYHEYGEFVSGVARLPRIVSLHDFKVTKSASGGVDVEVLAKTYRFKEGAELPKTPAKKG
ncbi:type 4a pilus biogenesis protein PilO [Paraferrimonas sedimenticola]|uniref:Pilus assembly protein PilO n=1 Tax=Paraferrimonas sedimenticola TaxID=375674 RepID=A0AA37W297_9GAMM|nr:type 4a pilus biogenesis protein PilO [Paraferrimonas sedimenticola]GLP97527.1 pilus assembly protein PilO [Paraferrimonas sedimenticola]